MDPKDDLTTPSSSQQSKSKTTVGSIRWAGEDSPQNQSGSFSMDVSAFEKNLQEKRERKLHEQSPRIDIRLKSTPKSSSSSSIAQSPSGNQIKVNIRHNIEQEPDISTGHDVVDHSTPIQSHHTSRVITYEKVFKQKTTREISVMKKRSPTNEESIQTPKVQRTVEYSSGKSLSTEQIGNADDSAYHSHRIRIASSGTPTTVSVSSSNASLPHDLTTSDENVFVRRTPSRERIFVERADSEPRQFRMRDNLNNDGNNRSNSSSSLANVSMNVVYAGDEATTDSPQELSLVSSVTDSNENIRRHLIREPLKSSSECGSPDWYSEYQASFHTERPNPRMDYHRSNSQYDNHIRQIRGIFSSIPKIVNFFYIRFFRL